jgi:hypothetical protein
MARNALNLLLIRAWIEPGSTRPLRARVRVTSGFGNRFEQDLIFSEAGEVGATVEAWLEDIQANGPD